MTTLTNQHFEDLKIDLDISEVWNDIRVLLPSYGYTLEWQAGVWVKIPIDVSKRAVDSLSGIKYGRRTKILNKHVIHSSFAEEYCQMEIDKYKDPCNSLDIKMVGEDDTKTALILNLSTKLSAQISYLQAETGLNDTGVINSLDLDIDLDRIPRLTMTINEVKALDLLDWFRVDIDQIDGVNVIG